MNKTGLSLRELSLILDVLLEHPEITKANLFGSRAKGNARSNSDIDLAVWGIQKELHIESLIQDLDALPLPYKFDVLAYQKIKNKDLREHIDRVGLQIYPKQNMTQQSSCNSEQLY